MPDFRYIARDQTGQRLNGTIAAASRGEAVAALASQQIFPLQVDDASHAVESPPRAPCADATPGHHLQSNGRSAA